MLKVVSIVFTVLFVLGFVSMIGGSITKGVYALLSRGESEEKRAELEKSEKKVLKVVGWLRNILLGLALIFLIWTMALMLT